MVDFGCGYGAIIQGLASGRPGMIVSALGLDFSPKAIEVARERNSFDFVKYEVLPGMDAAVNRKFVEQKISGNVDTILLIDLLEHVPDCKKLISELSLITRQFLIKLPVEASVVDNYLLPKEYPSSIHSNGHLREFDANNVYYFVRQLGLTPVFETLYRYDFDDVFPPVPKGAPFKSRALRFLVRCFKTFMSWILPTKLFLRLVGGGGYICVAHFDGDHRLSP